MQPDLNLEIHLFSKSEAQLLNNIDNYKANFLKYLLFPQAHQTAFVEVLSHVAPSPQQLQADQVVPTRTLAPGKDRPNFHVELRSQELFEGQPLHLETKLTP